MVEKVKQTTMKATTATAATKLINKKQ